MCVIRIGGEQAEYLAINVLGRSHPACTDYWDGNWLCVEVEVVAGGFRGLVTGGVRTDELDRFHGQFARLQELLKGTAEFTTMEGWVTIRVIGNGRGHMRFQCAVRDEPGTGNTLTCEFGCDQTCVPPMLAQLRRALLEFPVVGEHPT
jgi:hypothetical protein